MTLKDLPKTKTMTEEQRQEFIKKRNALMRSVRAFDEKFPVGTFVKFRYTGTTELASEFGFIDCPMERSFRPSCRSLNDFSISIQKVNPYQLTDEALPNPKCTLEYNGLIIEKSSIEEYKKFQLDKFNAMIKHYKEKNIVSKRKSKKNANACMCSKTSI